jgi:hypothetical protein
MSKQDQSNKAIRIDAWGFERGPAGSRQGGVPLFGVLLIVLGLALVLGQIDWAYQVGTNAIFLALGLVLILVGLRDNRDLPLFAGVLLAGLSFAGILSEMSIIHGSGWGTLFTGIGAMGVSIVRSSKGHRLGLAFVLGAFLAVVGAFNILRSNVSETMVGPMLLIGLGLYIVYRRTR